MLYEIEFPLGALSPDAIESRLFELGAIGITFEDGGDEPVLEPAPGEVRLWRETRVRALFDGSNDALHALGRLAGDVGADIARDARVRSVEERGWERAWMQH